MYPWLAAAFLAATASNAAAACVDRLPPTLSRVLSKEQFPNAHSVAWLSDDSVLIGSRNGVAEYSLKNGTATVLVTNEGIPNGIPAVEKLHTDGKTVVAFATDRSDIAYDLRKHRLTNARRTAAMLVSDIAVHDDDVVILGFPMKHEGDVGPLWIGKVGAPWDDFKLLHAGDPRTIDLPRFGMAPYGGAVLFLRDGTIAASSPAEIGILRYKSDGTRLPTLAPGLTELMIPKLPDIILRFGTDVTARYEQIINRQPVADDLINTAEGLAVVVRKWEAGTVSWELWFPDAKGIRRRIRLGIQDKRVVGGHLRCDGRSTRLICAFGTATGLLKPDQPNLVIFDLKKTEKDPACH